MTGTIHYSACRANSAGWLCSNGLAPDGSIRYCETCFGEPELSTSWDQGLSVNVIPFLKEGSNSIFVRTIVAGDGEGAVQFTTRQKCPRVCTDKWDDSQCEPLAGRSK
jgi:hypothetical protein